MEQINFRPLKANEIECRVGNVAKDGSGFFLLLYKNARVDQIILDETFGAFNWQCKYYQVKNTMVCSVGVWNQERNEWIWKDNGGDDDTTMEQVKAELSDSFKRACFNWGIGRELYFSPKIYIKCDGANDKFAHYSVKVIEYGENKRITNLAIVNDKTKEVVFLYGKGTKVVENGENEPKTPKETPSEPKGTIDKNDLKLIQAYVSAFDREESRKSFYEWIDQKFGTMSLENLTLSQGKFVVNKLNGRNK